MGLVSICRVTDPRVDEDRFWSLLEGAWATQRAEVNQARRLLATRTPDPDADDALVAVVEEALEGVLGQLAAASQDLSASELTDLDRVVERKLYDLDRADVQAVTDGSDDGFLYARGFILALGRDFYAAVMRDPSLAVLDGECEELCYFFAHLHDKRFGDYPETGSGISRESGSNPTGWPR